MKIQWHTAILFAALTLATASSCKEEVKPETPSKLEFLATKSSKTWQIQKLYINDTLYNLTPEQLAYTKTFKVDSSYVDSDGISGKYMFNSAAMELKENVLVGGSGTLTYKVETLDASTLVLRLTNDGTSSLNNVFHFRAK